MAFLSSQPLVMEYLKGRVKAQEAPPSSLGSLPPPDLPATSVQEEGAKRLPQAGEARAEEVHEEGQASPHPKRYAKELELGWDSVYMRTVQSLQLVLHGQSDPHLV